LYLPVHGLKSAATGYHLGFVCVGYGMRFFSQKGKKGSEDGRGVKEKQQSDNGKGTTPMQGSVVGIPTVDNTRPVSYFNVVPTERSSVLGSANEVTKELD
ncbi:hypothetical protein Tco_1040618, partial [Tanacetum coccineum]